MIRVGASELFTVSANLIDELTGMAYSGGVVLYDIRRIPYDLSPTTTASGVLTESLDTPGVYATTISINDPGAYLAYATCSGFAPAAEEIVIFAVPGSTLGNRTPEMVVGNFGSINMSVSDDDVRLSTKIFMPVVRTSNNNFKPFPSPKI